MTENAENRNNQQIIGIDFDGQHIHLGKIKASKVQITSDFVINAEEAPDSILRQLTEAVRSLFDQHVNGISIGVAGVVDVNNGIICHMPRIAKWQTVNLKSLFEKEFRVPVYVNNNANCFITGEKYFGKGQKYQNLVGLVIGDGIGAGAMHAGELLSGKYTSIAEFGGISYRDCTVEAYCSLEYFKRLDGISFEELIYLAEKGEKKVLEDFRRYGENLADAIQIIIFTMDPEVIILGGKISSAYPYFVDQINRKIQNRKNGNSTNVVKILVSDNPHASLLGASVLFAHVSNGVPTKKIKSDQKPLRIPAPDNEEKYNRLFNQIADPVFVFDKQTYQFLDCNEEVVRRIYGYSKSELRLMTPLDLHPPEDLEKVSKRLRIKNKDVPFRYTHITKTGKKIDVEVLSDEIDYDGRIASMMIVRDISDRIKTEKELQRKATQTALLYEVGKHLSGQLELDRLLKEIVESIRNYFDYFGVMLLLMDSKGKKLQLKSIAGGYEKIFPIDLTVDVGEGMIGNAAKKNQIQISGDVRTNPYYIKKAEEITLSELAAPIVSGNKVIGVLDMQSDQLYAFDKGDIEVVSTLCSQIASALQNAALYQKVQDELYERKQTQKALLKSKNNLQKAKRETDNILENVEEGLFTLNKEYFIASQYSAALSLIFEDPNLANRKLTDILHDHIDFGILNSTVEYLELMFNPDLNHKDIEELNPLLRVEFNMDDSRKKYLSFNFRRIKTSGRIAALFATVNDITNQIYLARRLEESEAHSKRQMEWLLNIMHVEPELIREFIEGVENEIVTFREILNSSPNKENQKEWIDHLYRSVHLIKGNASLLELNFFAQRAHECEENLRFLRSREQILSSDMQKLHHYTDELQRSISEMRGLIEKISQIHSHFRPKRSYETEKMMKSIDNFIVNLSQDLNKKVRFDYSGFDGKSMPHQLKLMVKDILIQLVRNSLYHGIESESERRCAKKNETGTIVIKACRKDEHFELTFHDDGRGLQFDRIRDAAKKIRQLQTANIESWMDQQVAELIFESGLSTAETCDISAGRGVGMDLVREKIKKHNGTITVNSEPGKFCEFVIILPLTVNGKQIK